MIDETAAHNLVLDSLDREADDLRVRYNAYCDFLNSETYKDLPEVERAVLHRRTQAMKDYLTATVELADYLSDQRAVKDAADADEPIPDFIQRLHQEHLELKEKTGKLSAFIFTEGFRQVSEMQQSLLSKQLSAMNEYLSCLHALLEDLHGCPDEKS